MQQRITSWTVIRFKQHFLVEGIALFPTSLLQLRLPQTCSLVQDLNVSSALDVVLSSMCAEDATTRISLAQVLQVTEQLNLPAEQIVLLCFVATNVLVKFSAIGRLLMNPCFRLVRAMHTASRTNFPIHTSSKTSTRWFLGVLNR